jgi:hypothetical protein
VLINIAWRELILNQEKIIWLGSLESYYIKCSVGIPRELIWIIRPAFLYVAEASPVFLLPSSDTITVMFGSLKEYANYNVL